MPGEDARALVVVSGIDGAPQARRVRRNGWTPVRARTFFEHLAATCNVRFAADMAGMSHTGAYAKRRSDPAFAAAWRDAVECGYARLEAMLIARAGGTHDAAEMMAAARRDGEASPPGGWPPTCPTIEFDPGAHVAISEALDSAMAITLMASHRKVVHGQGARGGGVPAGAATPDELADAILKQLDALARRRQKALS